MNLLFVAVNAKYSHTNLAVRYLHQMVKDLPGINSSFLEFTINQQIQPVLFEILRKKPDAVLFSCYIWNIEMVRRLGADIKKVYPHIKIVLGGPEVSFHGEELLKSYAWIDYIVCGEGEGAALSLVSQLTGKGAAEGGRSTRSVLAAPQTADMDQLPFPYEDLSELDNRIIYYESSRGCPFGCSYCLSCTDRRTRFRSLPMVYQDLQKFLDARVMQVKFVDRTFNCDRKRALAIWKYLAEHDNGITGFHFEIGGDLLEEEQLDFLSTVRVQLFQFEIGVQTTNEATLGEICRKTDMDKLRYNVKRVHQAGNIHQHLDLIAGLPLEGFERFAQSFDEVFALRPQQLQLGFLKLLKGTVLYQEREKYGLVHSEYPPYEVLRTGHMSYEELSRLKLVEEMTEAYYNKGCFDVQLSYLLEYFSSPFTLFLKLGEYFSQRNGGLRSLGKYEYYDLLHEFFQKEVQGDDILWQWLSKYDLILREKPKKLPSWLIQDETLPLRRQILAFYENEENLKRYLPSLLGKDPKYIYKTAHMERFPFDVTDPKRSPEPVMILCDYSRRTAQGNAVSYKVTLE